MICEAGVQSMPSMTGLGGYGGLPAGRLVTDFFDGPAGFVIAAKSGSNNTSAAICPSWLNSAPLRTRIRFWLGQISIVCWPFPEPHDISRGRSGKRPPLFVQK